MFTPSTNYVFDWLKFFYILSYFSETPNPKGLNLARSFVFLCKSQL